MALSPGAAYAILDGLFQQALLHHLAGDEAAAGDLAANVVRVLDTLEVREAGPALPAGMRCRAVPYPSNPWRKMPKRVRPYGSAEDAEFAGLGRGQPRTADET